jgi:hypothetical protein
MIADCKFESKASSWCDLTGDPCIGREICTWYEEAKELVEYG